MTETLVQIRSHVFDIFDAVLQLTLLTKVIDPDGQQFSPARMAWKRSVDARQAILSRIRITVRLREWLRDC